MVQVFLNNGNKWKPFWKKFSDVVLTINPRNHFFGVEYVDSRNALLAEYGAEYKYGDTDDWLEFDNDESVMLFLLKWS